MRPHKLLCSHGQSASADESSLCLVLDLHVERYRGTRTQEFTPKYEAQYPNGRRCGAACRNATVTVQLPG